MKLEDGLELEFYYKRVEQSVWTTSVDKSLLNTHEWIDDSSYVHDRMLCSKCGIQLEIMHGSYNNKYLCLYWDYTSCENVLMQRACI